MLDWKNSTLSNGFLLILILGISFEVYHVFKLSKLTPNLDKFRRVFVTTLFNNVAMVTFVTSITTGPSVLHYFLTKVTSVTIVTTFWLPRLPMLLWLPSLPQSPRLLRLQFTFQLPWYS